jgi:hypothetical protein
MQIISSMLIRYEFILYQKLFFAVVAEVNNNLDGEKLID